MKFKSRLVLRVTIICLASTLAGCLKNDSTPKKLVKDPETRVDIENKKQNTKSPLTKSTSANEVKGKASQVPLRKVSAVNINNLPDDMTICTISGSPIKIGDYRRMLKLQQLQLSTAINTDPNVRLRLLQEAHSRKMVISENEKNKLVKTAKEQELKKGKNFQEFLKEHHITEGQYIQEILGIGLAYKVANQMIEESLLPDLLQRELLSEAALGAGLKDKATKTYQNLVRSGEFALLQKTMGLPANILEREVIKTELAKLQMEKIGQQVLVTDAELKKFYHQNKEVFKHADRIKLSTLLVAAPEIDQGPITSVKTQVKKANPKLKDKEIDVLAERLMDQQQQKALILLGRAKAGEDFAKLVNENTDDVKVKREHNGGDLGFQEKQQLVPEIAEAVWGLKTGEVLPKLIKTGLGFQIIKVTNRQEPGLLSLSEVKRILTAKIKQDKIQQGVKTWLEKRMNSTKIEFSPKFLALANSVGGPNQATKR